MKDGAFIMQKFIASEEVTLYAESFGNAANTPVLLIAGAMAPAISWTDNFCEALSARGYLVIRFDNRDIGKSTHFPQSAPDSGVDLPYSIDDMVKDTEAVLDAFSTCSAHIVGHSLGGSIAQLFSIKNPQKVLSVTAIASPIIAKGNLAFVETDTAITEKLWSVLMGNPMYQDFARGAPEFMKVWQYLNGDWELDEQMALDYTRAIYETEVIGPAWNHTNVQENIPDIMSDLKQLDVPILFIQGENDYLPTDPENTRILAGHLPSADFVMIKNGGHMFFNDRLWTFLTYQLLNHFGKANLG